jgi:hypothetical protein
MVCTMPRITVSTDPEGGPRTHTEWVTPADFESAHFRTQLAERLAWAVQDACVPEHEAPMPAPADEPAPEEREERWAKEPVRA